MSKILALKKNNQLDIFSLTVSSLVLQEEPFVIQKQGGSAQFDGFIPDLLKKIEPLLNVTFDMKHVADFKYGSKRQDGNWTGLIGELVKGVNPCLCSKFPCLKVHCQLIFEIAVSSLSMISILTDTNFRIANKQIIPELKSYRKKFTCSQLPNTTVKLI